MDSRLRHGFITLFALVLTAGCGSTSGTRPHDMSVEEHREAARGAEALSEQYEIEAAVGDDATGNRDAWALSHLYQQHANAHHAAAETLAASSDPEACVDIAAEHRESCPLAGYRVHGVQSTPDGLRVTFADADATALSGHVRCHVAHAELMGAHEAASGCPLLGDDIELEVGAVGGGASLTLHGNTPEAIARVQSIYVRRESTP